MGAGRKTETYTLAPNHDPATHVAARNLTTKRLGGVIFGCTNSTMRECLSKQLFGLPSAHHVYVKNVTPEMPLFLFNYSDRKLHGIFEATSHGEMNIDPYGWTTDGSGRTPFPAQVRVHVKLQCRPLLESQFKPIIADNYYNQFNPNHFWFELDHDQTRDLLSLLAPSKVPKPAPQNTMMRDQALPSCSTVQKAEPRMPAPAEAENPTPVPNLDTDFPALPTRNTKAGSLKPTTSGGENLTSLTTVNWETEFPALPSHKTIKKKAVSCKPPTSVTSATSVPYQHTSEADLPTLPSSSSVEEPEWPYQHTLEAGYLNSSSLIGNRTSPTPQNTVKLEADFPDFPSVKTITEPEWLEALISEAEHLHTSSLKLDSVPSMGTYDSIQALSDVKRAEQEELQLIHTKLKELNFAHNSQTESQNIPSGDVVDSWQESPYSQFDQKSGESSSYFSAQSPGSMFYPWLIAMLLKEVQELKVLSTVQTEKMCYLEDKLVQAQFEIQHLKDLVIDGL